MRVRGLDLASLAPPAVWAVQPFLLGPLLGDALDPTSETFRRVASIGAWGWWFIVLVALVVHRPVTLSLGRVGAAAALPAALWAAAATEADTTALVGVVSATVAGMVPLLPVVGERFIDGESYGDERRYPLRPPAPVLVVLLVPTWAITVAGVVAGPLLLAARLWVAGGIALVVGVVVSVLGFAALHRLTRRFLVFVPNGVVVHDPDVLREPVLFAGRDVVGLAPAPDDATGVDCTNQALGLALELRLSRPVSLPVVTGPTTTEDQRASSILISPSRPAAVLATATDRGIPLA